MATIVTRSGKGSPLTHAEVDANFTNLNTDKLELSGGTMTGNLSFGDNDKAIFGAGSDLQIYHDGLHSYISDQGEGRLRLAASDKIQFYTADLSTKYAEFTASGAAELRYANATKFATTSTGVDITGTLTSDGLTVDGVSTFTSNIFISHNVTPLIRLEDTDTALDFDLLTAGSSATIRTKNGSYPLLLQTNENDRIKIAGNGDISFYEDTGTTAKFFWDASAERLGIGTTSPSALVDISKSGTGDYSTLKLSNTGASGRKYELGVGGSGTGNYAGKFYVYDSTAGQPRFSLDSSGNVGIGTISPDNSLHISYTDSTAYSDATHDAGIQIENTDTTTNSFSQLHFRTGNSDSYIRNIREGDNLASLAFLTDDGGATGDVGEAMRIDSSGNVGIGTSSPSELLEVSANTGAAIKITSTDTGLLTGETIGSIKFESNDASGTPPHTSGQIDVIAEDDFGRGAMAFSTGRNLDFQEAMRIDSSGRVGIGTSSPAVPLHIDMGTDNNALYIQSSDQFANIGLIDGSGSGKIIMDSGELSFTTGGDATTSFLGSSERMRIDSNGQVGIGTSSPAAPLEVDGGSDIAFFTGTNVRLKIQNPSTGVLQLNSAGAGDSLSFATVDTERMRIDSSGNLLVGKTTADSGATAGIETNDNGRLNATRNGSIAGVFNRLTSDGDIVQFRKDGTTVGSIGVRANDNLYINSPHNGIEFTNTDFRPVDGNGDRLDGTTDIGDADNRFKDLYLSGGLRGDTTFKNNAGTTEYARFDSSGNLLVGKTSVGLSGEGSYFQADGAIVGTRDPSLTTDAVFYANRLVDDGNLFNFYKDGTSVGSIGSTVISSVRYMYIAGSSSQPCGIGFYANGIFPVTDTGAGADNSKDLGSAGYRWDDVYATNGTIQTSDRNEKQDIAELTDAEQRVAVAAKGLLRKFRWQDAVEEKGDEARTHFGIIAQDLQAAFEAEGLDAGDYAMFIHTTWTDEETGEERSRMGVRYSELLAFIIAAI
jgi:hypothetical protein